MLVSVVELVFNIITKVFWANKLQALQTLEQIETLSAPKCCETGHRKRNHMALRQHFNFESKRS